jgi:hypothetical protein
MRLRFVTGANSAFFPTLMVLLQSFAEQIDRRLLYVCDYGLAPAQQEFLRRRALLLERSPALGPPMSPLREKAILHEYFRHSGLEATEADAVVWLDGDLTIVDCSLVEIEAVTAEMARRDIEIAACPQGTIAELVASLRRRGSAGAPFERSLAESAIDTAKPYYSTGIFLCRSPSFLERWSETSRVAAEQPVLDQNMFNIVVHRGARPVLALDIDIWQTQADAIDRVQVTLDPARSVRRLMLDGRSVKILHSTSPSMRQLFIGMASFSVADLVLEASFKLLRLKPLLEVQLDLLSRFLTENRTELLELEICQPLARSITGYAFKSAPQPHRPASSAPAAKAER